MPLTYATFLTRRHRQQMVKAVLPLLAKRLKFNEHHDELGRFAESDGSASITSTPEFRAWFKDSKVVDAQGKPLVVYHGTYALFTEFKETFGAFEGFYFTSNPEEASKYAALGVNLADQGTLPDDTQSTPNIMPVYLSIQHPMGMKQAFRILYDEKVDRNDRPAMLAALDRHGIDGFFHDAPSGRHWLAIRSEQVKSATGNSGAFDPSDPDLRKTFDESQHPRAPAGSQEGGQFTSGDDGGTQREQREYRGIAHVTFSPNTNQDPALIAENKAIIDDVLSKLPPGAADGLKALYVTDGTFGPLGAAVYIPPSTRRGYVSDEIMTHQAWLDKSPADKASTLLHEFGHRMQHVSHAGIFKEFKKLGLASHAQDMLGTFYRNYEAAHRAGETFAESFARYKVGQPLPKPLESFWKKSGL